MSVISAENVSNNNQPLGQASGIEGTQGGSVTVKTEIKEEPLDEYSDQNLNLDKDSEEGQPLRKKGKLEEKNQGSSDGIKDEVEIKEEPMDVQESPGLAGTECVYVTVGDEEFKEEPADDYDYLSTEDQLAQSQTSEEQLVQSHTLFDKYRNFVCNVYLGGNNSRPNANNIRPNPIEIRPNPIDIRPNPIHSFKHEKAERELEIQRLLEQEKANRLIEMERARRALELQKAARELEMIRTKETVKLRKAERSLEIIRAKEALKLEKAERARAAQIARQRTFELRRAERAKEAQRRAEEAAKRAEEARKARERAMEIERAREKARRELEIERQKIARQFRMMQLIAKEYEREFSCTVCDGIFTSEDNLVSHLMTHILQQGVTREKLFNTKIFRCTECGYESHYKANITRHLLTHGNLKFFKCSGCNFGSNIKRCLKEHMISVHRRKLKCPECNHECLDKESFSIHVETHQDKSDAEPQNDTSVNVETRQSKNRNLLECSECNFECDDVESLKKHMVSHVVLFNLTMEGDSKLRGRWERPRLPTSENETSNGSLNEDGNTPAPPDQE